ncbi:hypothetical protein [Nitrosovibrio sp. Nv4]|uniref:hypothetical protein n=1 Tax=Nitrosovibrio sp. Nv4 TaxID=1945880 RepID=UPI000BC8C226|nr:hypothetical protein [Nitrosovibrio sp. Nv4]SOD42470.1 hypothetical protein SAMN06298226_2810 [Nitrosovibrio sp. Nv4]
MHDEETRVTDAMFCVMPDNLQILGKKRRLAVQVSLRNSARYNVLLASQESSYATGQVFGMSGGEGNP